MKIRFLGVHNCESQNTKLTSLLIDDILVVDAGGLTSSLSFTAQQKLKAILLTHQHYDHIRDVPAIVFNFAMANAAIDIYSILPVYEILNTNLLNGTPSFWGGLKKILKSTSPWSNRIRPSKLKVIAYYLSR